MPGPVKDLKEFLEGFNENDSFVRKMKLISHVDTHGRNCAKHFP